MALIEVSAHQWVNPLQVGSVINEVGGIMIYGVNGKRLAAVATSSASYQGDETRKAQLKEVIRKIDRGLEEISGQ